ncbi:hypothetical protein V6C03_05125 [Methyloligella sp. 2.7D]|uniref:hypothetical protein n=1 Tax=unclassified Methyloligella TaxID=2625955 RepID=UPI00157C9D03|nr:hypothetical protein [Methyloligella sp. GL2]QKP76031.1 hypothetical protein HT051_00300 [Methyloligella sp. GL2]
MVRMFLARMLCLILALVLGMPALVSPAHALPAPLSEETLTEKSDLVALIRINKVECVGATVDLRHLKPLLAYQAQAEIVEVKKGDKAPGDIVIIEFNELPEDEPGPYDVLYYPGEEVWTHLIARGPNYRSTWWNARGKLVQPSTMRKLPKVPNQSFEAPKPE